MPPVDLSLNNLIRHRFTIICAVYPKLILCNSMVKEVHAFLYFICLWIYILLISARLLCVLHDSNILFSSVANIEQMLPKLTSSFKNIAFTSNFKIIPFSCMIFCHLTRPILVIYNSSFLTYVERSTTLGMHGISTSNCFHTP